MDGSSLLGSVGIEFEGNRSSRFRTVSFESLGRGDGQKFFGQMFRRTVGRGRKTFGKIFRRSVGQRQKVFGQIFSHTVGHSQKSFG